VYGFPIWAIIVIVGAIVVFIALGVFFFIRRRNAKLRRNLEDYNQLEGTNKTKV
jgi:membrane-associated protease RseP (regulator of RpoE activity)